MNVAERTNTVGQGALQLIGRLPGHTAFHTQVQDGTTVQYSIRDYNGNYEIGSGTYSAGTLTRNVREKMENGQYSAGGQPIYLTGNAVVGAITAGSVSPVSRAGSALPYDLLPSDELPVTRSSLEIGGGKDTLVIGGMSAAQARRQSKFTHTKVLAVAGETLAGNNRTYHYTATVEQSIPFDQVQLVFLNHSTAAQTIPAVAAAATSGLDMAVPTEPWVVGGPVVVPARSASGRPGIGLSAWLDCQSVPMADGSLRRIMLRAQSPVTDPFTVTDQASVNFGPDYSKWDIDGRTFRPYYGAVGDNTTTNHAAFVPTLSARGPIFGWRLRTRGKVLTVAGVGPSTTQGSGETGYQLSSWLLKACAAASTPDAPIEYLNWGLGSQTTLGYLLRFQEACAAGLVPGIAVFQAATSNDGTPSASVTANSRKYVAEFLATCEQYGVYPVITTRNPNTTAAFNAEAVAIAKAYDAELLDMRQYGVEVWDICTPLSAGPDTIYYNPAYTTDGTHPNAAGHNLLSATYTPRLRALAGL